MKGNSQSNNNPSVRKQKKEQSRRNESRTRILRKGKGNWMREVGSKSSNDLDEHWIEHGCDSSDGIDR